MDLGARTVPGGFYKDLPEQPFGLHHAFGSLLLLYSAPGVERGESNKKSGKRGEIRNMELFGDDNCQILAVSKGLRVSE